MKKISITIASMTTLLQVNAHAYQAVANVASVAPNVEQVNHPTLQRWAQFRAGPTATDNHVGAIRVLSGKSAFPA